MIIESLKRGLDVGLMFDEENDQDEMRRHFGDAVTLLPIKLNVSNTAQQNTLQLAKLSSQINHFQPDIVHLHNLDSREMVFFRLYQNTSGKGLPVICTLHDLASTNRLKKFLSKTGEVNGFTAIVSPSRYIHLQLESLAAVHRGKFRMIYHGVPPVETRDIVRSDEPILLFASDLYDHKGGTILLSAWHKLHKKFPNVTLIIAGEGNAKAFLEHYAHSYGFGGQVEFVGWLTQEELQSILRKDCILVMPSLLGEAFGLSAAEAAMVGAPVIVSRSGALTEIVEDRVSGFVVTPGDSFELANVLDQVLGDPHLREKIGSTAKKRAETLFSFANSFSEYELLYQEILQES